MSIPAVSHGRIKKQDGSKHRQVQNQERARAGVCYSVSHVLHSPLKLSPSLQSIRMLSKLGK
eukprot:1159569-Pelagomonas_calceolata.AAC.4